MKLIKNISVSQRVALAVMLILTVMFLVIQLFINFHNSNVVKKTIDNQAYSYLNTLSYMIIEVEKQSPGGFSAADYAALKQSFNKPAFYTTDYPFLVDASGTFLIHLFREGQKFSRDKLNIIYSSKVNNGRIDYTEVSNGQERIVALYFSKIEAYNGFIAIPININEAKGIVKGSGWVFYSLYTLCTVIALLFARLFFKPLITSIRSISSSISKMSVGERAEKVAYSGNDEVGSIALSLNNLIDGLGNTANFASEIGRSNLESCYSPLGPNDLLGNSLLDMRQSLKHAALEEEKRKEEDKKRNWTNAGLARFSDILRQNNNNLQALADSVIQNLLDYLNATQAGLFILTDEYNEEPRLDLLSAFAFNRKKFIQKSILIGEGLVGNCALEKQTVYLKEIPEDYIEITSGLGDATPRVLLICPLKVDENVFGVLEIASFSEFQSHEVEFVEKIGESIASTLSSVKNNIRTKHLLEQSQQQREEMAAQEEEMRQNMEEMQATQEEMARKTAEMEGMSSAINEALLFAEISEYKTVQTINSNFLSLLGCTKSDIEDSTFDEFIHPTDRAAFTGIWKDVLAGTAFKGTLKWTSRQNDEMYVLCSISPAFDEMGEIFKVFFLGQDVTQSKLVELRAQEQAEQIECNLIELQAEQELAQQKEQEISALLKALDSSCLVTEMDANGTITFVNDRNIELLGDSKEAIVGKQHGKIDLEAKQNPAKYNQFWNNLLAGIPQHREFSLKVAGKNVWISEHYTPIIDSNGYVSKIINIGVDISKGKEIELQLQHQIDELSKQLRNKL